MIRAAQHSDLDRIAAIYAAVHDAEEQGYLTIGWSRDIYPVRATAEAALARGDLFVEDEDGVIAASAIINQIQVPEYADCTWRYDAPEDEVMVLHTLVVDPAVQSHGHGTRFVRFYEQYALEHGCRYLRMDTQEKNANARAFYRKLGYAEPGIVPCVFNGIPDVSLVCLEKRLPDA